MSKGEFRDWRKSKWGFDLHSILCVIILSFLIAICNIISGNSRVEIEMNWYRVDLVGGGSRFVEINYNEEEMFSAVSKGGCVKVGRQVIGVPVADNKLGFATIDQVSPLVLACNKGEEYFNLTHVVQFGVVNTDSEIWKAVRKSALKETVIDAPSKGLIMP
jgi:hypothetical protein